MLKVILKFIYYRLKLILFWPSNLLKRNDISFSVRVVGKVCLNNSKVGKYSYIGSMCIINYAQIGNYCSIAPNVQIGGMEHSYWWGSTSAVVSKKCIYNKITIIEDDVWIAAQSVIKQGIKIGRGSVVGAGAVVIKDIPPYSIVVGNPAKVIRKRFNDKIEKKLVKSEFWKYKPKEAKRILSQINY